jgi:hypothetical protein
MNVGTTLETNAQFAESGKPGMCALDDPTMPSKSLLVFYTSAGDTGCNSALLQVTPAPGKVKALVRMQLVRAFAGLAIQSRHRRDGIDCALREGAHQTAVARPTYAPKKCSAPLLVVRILCI